MDSRALLEERFGTRDVPMRTQLAFSALGLVAIAIGLIWSPHVSMLVNPAPETLLIGGFFAIWALTYKASNVQRITLVAVGALAVFVLAPRAAVIPFVMLGFMAFVYVANGRAGARHRAITAKK